MSVNLSMLAGAGAQFFDSNGTPLAGGKLYTYSAGTTTPRATYTTSSGAVAHANPIILDAGGRVPSGGEIWLTDAVDYKFVLANSSDVTIATYDNISGNSSGVYATLAASNGSSLIGFLQAGTKAVATTVQAKMREVTSVLDFGADPTGAADSTTAIQNAIDYVESTYGGGGGVVFVPRGSYKCTDKIVVKGFIRLVGENYLSTSLFWDSTYTSGHCVEFGPSQLFPTFTFGSRIENISLSGQDVYRGLDKAMVYTQGAHQYSGLYNVFVRRFRSIGVHYDVGNGGPATFALHQVELQGSSTAPTSGTTIGIKCSAAGAVISAIDLIVQGDAANVMSSGILMSKDNLVLTGGHFEHCTTAVNLTQNESTVCVNTISGVTGHNSVPTLVGVASTNNLIYSLTSVSNVTTNLSLTLAVLEDLKAGVTISALGGTALASYTNQARRGGNNLPFAWANYLVGSGLGEQYGVSGVTVVGTGDFTFTLSRAMNSTDVCPVVQGRFASAAPGFFVATVLSTTQIQVNCYDSAGVAADPQRIYFSLLANEN